MPRSCQFAPTAVTIASLIAESFLGIGIARAQIPYPIPRTGTISPLTPGTLLVGMNSELSRGQRIGVINRIDGCKVSRESTLVPGLLIVVPTGSVSQTQLSELADKIRKCPGVRFVETDTIFQLESPIPGRPEEVMEIPGTQSPQSNTFNINLVRAPESWPDYGKGASARVCVLDTGLDFQHPAMPAPIASTSFVPGQTADDFNFHGTHCSGTIVGKDGLFGSYSIAPDASLMTGKVVCDGGWGALSWLVEGIEWAVANNAQVISMSLSSDESSQALEETCQAAFDAGVLLVAAAGNESTSAPRFPAAYPSVLAVGALNADKTVASFSNTGPHLSLSAPGVNVPSAIPIPSSNVTWNSISHKASQFTGSFGGSVSGPVISCGDGSPAAIPPAVAGRIAHIRRSDAVSFASQFGNAAAAGAIGVIISDDRPDSLIQDSLEPNFLPVPCELISQADGDALLAAGNVSASLGQSYAGHFYGVLTGTSQATPHVAGVAAIIRGAFPGKVLSPVALRWVLEQTAEDVHTPGFDEATGFGLVNAKGAADYFAGRIRCPGDLNNDGLVDDSDFGVFVGHYDSLISPSGGFTGADLTGDGLCDDTDFSTFVISYDALICP